MITSRLHQWRKDKMVEHEHNVCKGHTILIWKFSFMRTSPVSSVGAEGRICRIGPLQHFCWQQFAKRNVWCKECSKVTAVQAFEDHITMAKATSTYIHIYSPCKHRQIAETRNRIQGRKEPFQGKLVEKVGLNTGETEVKNKHKWPEFKRKGQTL